MNLRVVWKIEVVVVLNFAGIEEFRIILLWINADFFPFVFFFPAGGIIILHKEERFFSC